MELVYFTLLCENQANIDIETGEILEEEKKEFVDIALHELGNWLNQNFHKYSSIKLVSRQIEKVYTQIELDEELDNQLEEYNNKIENAKGFMDNVMSHLDDLRTTISDIEYYCDEAEEDCDYAQQELD